MVLQGINDCKKSLRLMHFDVLCISFISVRLRPEKLGTTGDAVSNSGAAATKNCEAVKPYRFINP